MRQNILLSVLVLGGATEPGGAMVATQARSWHTWARSAAARRRVLTLSPLLSVPALPCGRTIGIFGPRNRAPPSAERTQSTCAGRRQSHDLLSARPRGRRV